MRASALPPVPAVQDRRRSRASADRPAAVLFVLVILVAASPAAALTGALPVRSAHRRLFPARTSSRRFRLLAASEIPPDAPDPGQTAPLGGGTDPTSAPGAGPARPGLGVGAGVQLPDGPIQLTKRVGHDLHDLGAGPFHAHARAWEALAGGVLLVGLTHAADEDVRTTVRREGSDSQSWAETIRPLGQEGGLALAALAWGAGEATGHPGISATAEDSLEATVVAAGFITPLLKVAVGRDRPRSGRDSDSFSGDGESFPSGEVTQAFAMASVIAAHSRRPWVDALAWGTASAVAWERLRLDAHWASDVAAGALIGTGVGRWVVHRNRPRLIDERAGVRSSLWNEWTLTPLISTKRYGLGLRVTF